MVVTFEAKSSTLHYNALDFSENKIELFSVYLKIFQFTPLTHFDFLFGPAIS